MAIIDPEEGAARPMINLSVWGLQYVQDYGHSVFIVVSDKSLVSIGCIGSHNSITLQRMFGRFVIRDDDFVSRLQN